MIVDVVMLRATGLRLRPSELAPAVRGDLVLADDDGHHTSLKRATSVAHLFNVGPGDPRYRGELLRPLFDARVIRIEGDTITVAGIELEASADTTRTSEHGQVWRCTVVTASGTPAVP